MVGTTHAPNEDQAAEENRPVDDESMCCGASIIESLMSPSYDAGTKKGHEDWTWGVTESDDNTVVSSSEESALSDSSSELSSFYSASPDDDDEIAQHMSLEALTGEQLAFTRRMDVSSPPPQFVVIPNNSALTSSKHQSLLAPLTVSTPSPSQSQDDPLERDNENPLQKLSECMERSALSRSLVEAHYHSAIERFKNKTSAAKQQKLWSNINNKKVAKASVTSRLGESVSKYPISKQIKSALMNKKKHQFFFGDKYASQEGPRTSNFRHTGLKFRSNERLMRLDAKLKMLDHAGMLPQSRSAPSLRNETMRVTPTPCEPRIAAELQRFQQKFADGAMAPRHPNGAFAR